ncbi:hypothetical protein [Ralstonia solanacearum]|uniref:hypothetical protein n=1 Tax=Ralstonia solanacearum TaxID=305 RepID=UPI0018D0C420|nr:hypothetical protein [Ralstonia solanacearum]
MEGLEKLTKEFDEASRVLKSLDGEIATVPVVPGDDASIQAAIRRIEQAIDSKAARYRNNPLVSALVTQLKETYRDHILELGRR